VNCEGDADDDLDIEDLNDEDDDLDESNGELI